MERFTDKFCSDNQIHNDAKITFELCLTGVITRSNAITELTNKLILLPDGPIRKDIAKKIQTIDQSMGLRRPE